MDIPRTYPCSDVDVHTARPFKFYVTDNGKTVVVSAAVPDPGENIGFTVLNGQQFRIACRYSTHGMKKSVDGSTRIERSTYTLYTNTVQLPAPVDVRRAKVRYAGGILSITLPKRHRSLRKRSTR